MGRKEVQPCIAGLRQYGMSFEEAFDEVEHLQKIVSDRQAFLQDLFNVRQSPSPNHHSSLPVNMSTSPNSYSLSSMSNPPPSVSIVVRPCLSVYRVTNVSVLVPQDFAFALANTQQMTSDFPLPYQDSGQPSAL